MKLLISSYITSLITLLALDALWIGVIAKKFYATYLGPFMGEGFKFGPAAIFYVLYPIGVTFLVIQPAMQSHYSLTKVFLLGALLGLVAYGAYDLTNHATLKDWPFVMTFVDMLWGTLLSGTASVIAVSILRKYF